MGDDKTCHRTYPKNSVKTQATQQLHVYNIYG